MCITEKCGSFGIQADRAAGVSPPLFELPLVSALLRTPAYKVLEI